MRPGGRPRAAHTIDDLLGAEPVESGDDADAESGPWRLVGEAVARIAAGGRAGGVVAVVDRLPPAICRRPPSAGLRGDQPDRQRRQVLRRGHAGRDQRRRGRRRAGDRRGGPGHRDPRPNRSGCSSASTGSTRPVAATRGAPAWAWPSSATSLGQPWGRGRSRSREGEGSTFVLAPARSARPIPVAVDHRSPAWLSHAHHPRGRGRGELRRRPHHRARDARASASRSPATAPRR